MTKRKHTDETIFEIRRLLATGTKQKDIQALLGIAQHTISNINTGKHVPTVELPKQEALKTSALSLFKKGHDYIAIGQFLHLTEAEVEKQIHAERKAAIRQSVRREQRRILQQYWMRRYREEMREIRSKA
jgi:hypothetical protein